MAIKDQVSAHAAAISLDDLADLPRWIAWRLELRSAKDGKTKETKVLYNPHAPDWKASSTDPATWGARADAEQAWHAIRRQALRGVGGVGIVLGQLDREYHLLGIDLDSCINTKTNQFRPWAQEIIERFDTYTEISPSGRGVKLFFRIRANQANEVKLLLGQQSGREFSVGEHKEIALYRTARYFAVTDERLEDMPQTLRIVPVEHVRWFLQEAGPNFKARFNQQQNPSSFANHQADRDESESGHARRFFEERRREGDNYEQARTAIIDDLGRAGDWAEDLPARRRSANSAAPEMGASPPA